MSAGILAGADVSHASICVESGAGMTLWCAAETTFGQPSSAAKLQLAPEQCAVIGRQEGGKVPYLDPRFAPTQMMPRTGQCVLTRLGHGRDNAVSRGHFTLRGAACGIILINGVPRRGGGIRPPLNGTVMLSPAHRWLAPGEELHIDPGCVVRIQLPNRTVVAIGAE